jgi:hypothetical protein
MIDKTLIEARLADLNQQKAQTLRNVDALDGAIQDCAYWLKQIETKGEDHEGTTGKVSNDPAATAE